MDINKLKKKFNFDKNDKTLATELMQKPKKEKSVNMPTTDVFKQNITHQMDILYLPDDDGYKYALVIVDLALPRYIEARPLKNLQSENVKKAVLDIYAKSKYLKKPLFLELDRGAEFAGNFKDYFITKCILVYKRSGRKRQQSVVETANQILQKYLFRQMLSNEIYLDGDELVGDWVDNLQDLLYLINHVKTEKMKNNEYTHPHSKRAIMSKNCKLIVGEGETLDIIPIGTPVRVILDEPRNIQGIKEHGKFREVDLRWENKNRKVEQILLRPNQPPMYLISGIKNASYTKQQLQIIPKDEILYNIESITKFKIEKLVKTRKYKNKIQYLVKWLNYSDKDNTWENEENIPKIYIDKFNKL
jgi:hypothetical protein